MKTVEALSGTTCVVVVPVYKTDLSIEEKWSFQRCLEYLSAYDVVLVAPKNLKKEAYLEIALSTGKEIRFESFLPSYFKSISGYNNLLLSKAFYSRFSSFEFMLIYQLDAYVFSKDLNFWLHKGFDYVGAPSFDHLDRFEPENTWIGNGGLSLRKIRSFLSLYKGLSWYETYVRVSLLHKESFTKRVIETMLLLVQAFFLKHNVPIHFRRIKYEDLFWSHTGCLKIPDFKTASEFSFEKFPSILFEKNSEKLPFGSHAWATFEYKSFWKKYIPGERM